jgi:hypothetical protein
VVIDETSFDFAELTAVQLEDFLDRFNDAIWTLRDSDIKAWKPPMFADVPCRDGSGLFEFLSCGPGTVLDRDTRNRFYGLIDKCPEWDDAVPDYDEVALAGGDPVLAMSVAFALTLARRRQGVACLVFGACARRGFVPAASGPLSAAGRGCFGRSWLCGCLTGDPKDAPQRQRHAPT